MNLPLLTAKIGRAWRNDDIFSVLHQEPKKPDKNKEPYAAVMTFDLSKRLIEFKLWPYNSGMVEQHHFFGNNKSASKQFHVVREGKDLHYLMRLWKDLYDLLVEYQFEALAADLEALQQAELIIKENGYLNLDRLAYNLEHSEVELGYEPDKKRVIHKTPQKTESITMEELVRRAVDGQAKDKIILLIPEIKTPAGELIEVAKHDDYLQLVKKHHKLEESESNKDENKSIQKTTFSKPENCYVCGMEKNDLACADYSTKFSRKGINKIFTTTTINYAKNIQKSGPEEPGHEHNYAFCKACFDDLRQGEKIILDKFATRLAGERTFILPEGLRKDFQCDNINEIKKGIDFAFQSNEADYWIENVKNETEYLCVEMFNLNFIVYDTDGNSVTILQTINDVNNTYFVEIIEVFKERLRSLKEHLRYFSLGSIYHVIPVKTRKDGKQIDVNRVLTFYKSILKREQIKIRLIYRFALEALDKGLKKLASNDMKSYANLGLYRFINKDDFYIKHIIFSYVVVLEALQDLGIVVGLCFGQEKEGKVMDEKIKKDECPEKIWEAETFLEEHRFTNEMKALFYLGLIMKRVANAQFAKNHKNKPILKKINFQGMSQKDVLRFYEDVTEKLRQYNVVDFYTEWLLNRTHHYMGTALVSKEWPLDNHATVFFIMAGYAFQIGKKSASDLNEGEQTSSEDIEKE